MSVHEFHSSERNTSVTGALKRDESATADTQMSEDGTSVCSMSGSSEEDESELDLGFNRGGEQEFYQGEAGPSGSPGRANDTVQHVPPEMMDHDEVSLLSSEDDGDPDENGHMGSPESHGHEPTAESIPTEAICGGHAGHASDHLYAPVAQPVMRDEGPSILLSDSFDDEEEDFEEDSEDEEGARQDDPRGIAGDPVDHDSDEEDNGPTQEHEDETLSDAHVVELPHDQPDIIVGGIDVQQEVILDTGNMDEAGNTDDECVDKVIIQAETEQVKQSNTHEGPIPMESEQLGVNQTIETQGTSKGTVEMAVGNEAVATEAQPPPSLSPAMAINDVNVEADQIKTQDVAEAEEDLLDYEEEDFLDIDIKDICGEDGPEVKKAIMEECEAKEESEKDDARPSEEVNDFEACGSKVVAACSQPNGKEEKEKEMEMEVEMEMEKEMEKEKEKGLDVNGGGKVPLKGSNPVTNGGVKRKREPIPAPPPSRGTTFGNTGFWEGGLEAKRAKDSENHGIDGFEENLLVTVNDRGRKVTKKGRFSMEKWKRLISSGKSSPTEKMVESGEPDEWKNCRVVQLKSSKVKVFQMDSQPDLNVTTEGEPEDSYIIQQDIMLPDPLHINDKDYNKGLKRAQGFLDINGQKHLMSHPTSIRYDLLCELGTMNLQGIQYVQRHIMDRLKDIKSKKSGMTSARYCKEVEDDREYDLGCKRLRAFVKDIDIEHKLLHCSLAKRRQVIITFGTVPFPILQPCPGDYLLKLLDDVPLSLSGSNVGGSKHKVSPQSTRADTTKSARHTSLRDGGKGRSSTDGHVRDKGGSMSRDGKNLEYRKKGNSRSGKEEPRSQKESESRKGKREPIPAPPKRTSVTTGGDGLRRSPHGRRERSPITTNKGTAGSERARTSMRRNHRQGRSSSHTTRQLLAPSQPATKTRMDSMLDARTHTVTNYDLNDQSQRQLLAAWSRGNELQVVRPITSHNTQQTQAVPYVLPVQYPVDLAILPRGGSHPGLNNTLATSDPSYSNQQGLLVASQQQHVLQPRGQQPSVGTVNQATIFDTNRQVFANTMDQARAVPQALGVQRQPQIGQNPGLVQLHRSIQQRVELKLVGGGFLCADPARSEESHPFMQLNEDAFFICSNALAVADGLGGTLQFGISSAEYARSLTETSARAMQNLINESHGHAWTPKVAIEYACSQIEAQGASTLCLLAFDPRQSILHVGKVGDGGYVVLRPAGIEEMEVVSPWVPFKDPNEHPMGIKSTHYLTSPALRQQIGGLHPNHAIESQVIVQEGDIVVLATDGFFDVIYLHGEKGRLLRRQIRRLAMDPDILARQLADLARHFASGRTQDCPICEEARLLNDQKTAAGALPDDIAVVVAHVTKA